MENGVSTEASEPSSVTSDTNSGGRDAQVDTDTPHLEKPLPPSTESSSSPDRSLKEHRSGVLVQEVDEGQPCLMCRDKCPGYTSHVWRKTCQSCKCTRELHDVYHEDWVNVRERLGLGDSLGRSSRELCLQEGYTWVPPGLTSEQIYDYMSCLPGHKVPRLGTPGEKARERQLMLQLPKQDLALAYTRHVEPQYHTSFKDFVAARNDIALDIGIIKHHIPHDIECRGCGGVVSKGSVAVVAPRFGDSVAWHPGCFTCGTCSELLVDLVYCVWEDTIQCGRHYAEKLKPRCSACDELIFSGEYTKAMSKDWHSGHFCCWQCDDSLTGQRYVLKDDHPYCIKCYEAVFANTCEDCNTIIGIDSKDLSYKDKHWHEKCFLCSKCQVSLVDKQFGSKLEKIFCGPCYDAQFATRCDGCGEIFRAGNKKMEYKARQWHEKCFCCCVCKTPIGTKSFIPRDQDIYCAACYEDKFATRCVKCNKIITSGGVTYKSEPWHRECFTCTHCDTSLAGQRFTSRDDKPYCADCFGELFAKRCTACTKPITGIGGTRFISFEDRHWHNDCFICAVCKGSLVGKGFITDGADILCPDCAKQKLM
ncbi:prickle planar cell polarity protein 3-A-like isoform X3 [Macrobrachium nipponense]|uniref:prickle planar cell polarity protein 3-A-like isoform X3 n=1 Tax=Macrobrachium nipponense TaxID=159736 RepID=UPI0030C8697D